MNFKNWLTKADEIKENCQPFLRMTDQPLYRGVVVPLTGMFLRAKTEAVRKDRKPRDSSMLSHELADHWFYTKYKLRPRSQGLFCTSNPKSAQRYGKLAYVFPVGNFRYMWATDQHGAPLYDSLHYMNDIKDAMRVSRRIEGDDVARRVLKEYTFHIDKDLEDAQDAKAEIILFCDEVILVPADRIPDYIKFIRSIGA